MNKFNGFTRAVSGGHHAMLRFAEDGQAEPVLGEGGKPVVYPTELEAQKAVTDHLLAYFNGHLRRDGATANGAKAAAERIFLKGGKVVAVEHRR